jgi:hypothetical protein
MNNVAPDGFGSTSLNPRIENYADLVYRVKCLLGWPSAPIEITDEQWAHIIDKAVEDFTEFEGNREEEYLVFCANSYTRNCGVKLDDLLNVGCNTQHCYTTTVIETVTSTRQSCSLIETGTAFLSVTPFVYPEKYNFLNPNALPFSGLSGQNFYLTFDSDNPWNAQNVCAANCVTINPSGSRWYLLSSNPLLSSTTFDFVTNPILSSVLSSVSYNVQQYGFYNVPMSALGTSVSAIPIKVFPLSAFYPQDSLIGPPVKACLNIGMGKGVIYPNCDVNLISSCTALTAQYSISPTINYILTSSVISSVTIQSSASTFSSVSSYFTQYCGECSCVCSLVSSYNSENQTYSFSLISPYISSNVGFNWSVSALDFSDATHAKLYGVPSCTNDGSIPLDSNDGIISTFTICNTAFSTNGPLTIKKMQFFYDYKPPVEILYDNNCSWTNNGFTFSYYNSSYSDCVRSTPRSVPVDVTFSNCQTITEIGTVSSTVSSNYDGFIQRKRKVLGVFNADTTSQGGYFGGGGDLLFNFDYALLANTFGYDLMGNRNMLGKQGYDLLTYHMARSFVEHSKKILRYVSYQFNPRTQYLKLMPEPASASYNTQTSCSATCCNNSIMNPMSTQCYIVGVYLEPPVEQILSSYFIKEYVLALAMVTLGRIRSTFGGVTLYGGATLNGDALIAKGEERIKELIAELRDQYRHGNAPPMFYIG